MYILYIVLIYYIFFSDKFDVEACQDLNENKVNLNFTLNLDDRWVMRYFIYNVSAHGQSLATLINHHRKPLVTYQIMINLKKLLCYASYYHQLILVILINTSIFFSQKLKKCLCNFISVESNHNKYKILDGFYFLLKLNTSLTKQFLRSSFSWSLNYNFTAFVNRVWEENM